MFLTPKTSQLYTMADSPVISWHSSLEEYFASVAEKANCLSWCHKKAEAMYANRKTFIDLPVIVLSAVTGFMSVGSTTMFAGNESTASIALGAVSLFVSVLNTTGSYFGWSKRQEGHRISSIQYSRLYRFLQVEMGLPRAERQKPTDLLKYVREQYDRLQEISPLIPETIAEQFKSKFEKVKDISKPEELNGLDAIQIYPEPLTNESPAYHSTLHIRREEGVQSIFEPRPTLPQTSGRGESSPAGGRITERRESEGHTSIPIVRDGHEEGDSNP